LTFKTRQQQSVAKKNGRIDGCFGKVTKGCPAAIKIGLPLPMNQTTKMVLGNSEKKRVVSMLVPIGICLVIFRP